MAKKNNIRQMREQQELARKAKFAEQQAQREQQKCEAAEAAEKENASKQSAQDNSINNVKKSAAKAAGVKSVFAVNDTIYMTSFGKGNDAVLEKKIVSDSHEDINTASPAFTLTDVNNVKYELSSRRIKSLNATSDNPMHNKDNSVSSDMLELKSTLEEKFYGKTFGKDNIHIQLIYNILDIEKILAQYSTNAVYALNNLLRKSQNEDEDIFDSMTTDKLYDKTNDKVKTFIEDFKNNPRLAYFGSAFFACKERSRDDIKNKKKDNLTKLRSDKEVYDILALVGKLRHWCIHGNEKNSKWLYALGSIDDEFRDIMDKLYDEAVKRINNNFVYANRVNIQILEKLYPKINCNDIIREYYSFVVTKKYKNIGFSIKKLRELMTENTSIKETKHDSVRPKLYKLIDFIIWHGYENEDKSEADRLVDKLRGSIFENKEDAKKYSDKYKNNFLNKEQVYIDEAKRLWGKYESIILNDVLCAVNGKNIGDLQEDKKLKEINIGEGLIRGAKDVSYFTKLMYLLTMFIDGKEINDLLTTLINKFDNIRSFNETMESLSLTTDFTEEYKMFNNSEKILGELEELNSFARMCPIDASAKRIMYADALDILGIEKNMTDDEFEKFLDKLLCLDANGNPIKDKALKNSGLRNFIANNVIDSVRFRYIIRYGNSKKIRNIAKCEPAVKFVLKGIPPEQIERYYKPCCSDNIDRDINGQRGYLADQIKKMNFEKIKQAGEVQDIEKIKKEARDDKTKGRDYIKKATEDRQRYQALVRLYLTVMYLMLKNLVNVNSRYVIGFHCLERDAVLYNADMGKDYRDLTFMLMGVSDDVKSGALTGECDVSKAESAGNRHLKNKRWYALTHKNLKNSDNKIPMMFRNTVAHLNAIRNIDENIIGIAYVNNYFELYHYIIQRHLQKNSKNPSKPTAEYFGKLDKNNSYVKDFVKAYCTPMAYSLVRYKNLTIDGLFDKNNRFYVKGDEEES